MEKAQNYPVYLNLIRWTILAFLACITVTQLYFRLMGTGGIRTFS
ncbi:hypothetical protein SAMN04488122_2245 [Chitinophaga arvensicola]|uniref:Uncharacterized protein n=1 Tax=Chitinophaga arvensicola TaxID=29529 RepID=A0A1I0R4T3_9BACT|nr:hypothetical protein SAMN04488122_2245 [Chitinophaga arvensicola]